MAASHKLNKEQETAAAIIDGPALIIAGAGTGKTATLAARLANMVRSGIPAERILLLTFTRRAALEMIERAGHAIGNENASFSGGTFHSFSMAVLRQFGSRIGLADTFTILDSDDVNQIIGILRADCEAAKHQRFPQSRTIAAILSKAVNTRRPVGAVVLDEYPQFSPLVSHLDRMAYDFVRWKAGKSLVDFDDLLVLLINLLQRDEEVLKAVRERWRYFMIDEYQDTNILQADIVALLGGHDGNVMVVGDDAQSIYRFRGACHANLMHFPRTFPSSRRIILEQNYRSTQPILDLSNAILGQMKSAFRKTLRTERVGGSRPLLVCAPSTAEEAKYVVKQIRRLQGEGIALDDIAVLFRSGRQSYELETELQKRRISFVKYGGIRFAEAAHVKDVISLLRLLVNGRDSLSLNRVLALVPGVGPKTAAGLQGQLAGQFTAAALRRCSPPPRSADFFARLAGSVEAWHKLVEKPPRELINQVIEFYRPIMTDRFDDWPKRDKDLNALAGMANEASHLVQFLGSLSLDPPNRMNDQDELDEGAGRLVLSTIHSAKGLEWSHVFILRAHEGSLPMMMDTTPEGLDEELRLLYVAVTRAAHELVITWPEETDRREAGVSRFLREIPHELLDRETLPGAGNSGNRGRHSGDWRQSITW